MFELVFDLLQEGVRDSAIFTKVQLIEHEGRLFRNCGNEVEVAQVL